MKELTSVWVTEKHIEYGSGTKINEVIKTHRRRIGALCYIARLIEQLEKATLHDDYKIDEEYHEGYIRIELTEHKENGMVIAYKAIQYDLN
jgi:hypothetical protein